MVDLVTLQALAYVAQIVGVVGTLTAAFIAVRSYINANKRVEEARKRELETRQAQLFMAIFDKFSTKEMVSMVKLIEDYGVENLDDFKKMLADPVGYSNFYPYWEAWESIGVLVHEGLFDIRIIARAYGNHYRMYWEKWGPFFIKLRSEWNYPRYMIESEYLYDRLIEFGKSHPDYQVTPQ